MDVDACTDQDLIRLAAAAKAGDKAALGTIYECCRPTILRFFQRLLPSEAEDLTQKLFLALEPSLRTYHEEGRFHGWLRTIAYRIFLQEVSRGPVTEVTLKSGMDVFAQRTTTLFATRKQELRRLVPQLPAGDREAWELRAEGWTIEEIAERLGIERNSVDQRLHRARLKLTELLVANLAGEVE